MHTEESGLHCIKKKKPEDTKVIAVKTNKKRHLIWNETYCSK